MKFKMVKNWVLKKEFQSNKKKEELFKAFHPDSNSVIQLGYLKGKLVGTDKAKEDILDGLIGHYRTEGIWMAINNIIDINLEENKEKRIPDMMR